MTDADHNQPQPGEVLETEGAIARDDMALEDVPGSPTWPIPTPGAPPPAPPPVGLNWGAVAERLGVDRRVVQHDGQIILAGEYFPEAGYVIDPGSMTARFVDVGELALRAGYFLGELTLREFKVDLPLERDWNEVQDPVVPVAGAGPIIGLFADETDAARAKDRILRGSLGAGIAMRHGPLGVELEVAQAERGGEVASIMASNEGAVISISGVPTTPPANGPMATGPAIVGEQADAYRPGTGVAGDSQTPARELGSSEELSEELKES